MENLSERRGVEVAIGLPYEAFAELNMEQTPMAIQNVENSALVRNVVTTLMESADFQSMLSETLREVMEGEVEELCG
ncbi:MAG: hypothetical protein JRJ84_07295, partial [Deltaproteobacteria bacterium]|nr:hypothetical protein [Deltaproteobacteria bacterium]